MSHPSSPLHDAGPPGSAAAGSRLRTVLACDLRDLQPAPTGDAATVDDGERRIQRKLRELINWHEGREIERADGVFILFERAIQAVAFSIEYQRALVASGASTPARIGIHVGELSTRELQQAGAPGVRMALADGATLSLAARLLTLARPGQILLSGVAYALAHRAQFEIEALAPNLRWLAHGRYQFDALPTPLAVHEVGESGIGPLQAPPGDALARREVPTWRRPRALAMEALLLLAVILVPLGISMRSPGAVAFAERDWVVLADLQNHSPDASLGVVLDTAFRISLEQSRFVNVLSRASMAETLAHMDLPPDTVVYRAIAAEMALRDGARAMLLPTVSDLGGRMRVSVEVVDPRTQSTLFAQSVDGSGSGSTLASIDAITRDLRVSLGENLKVIERSSAPLPDVTTSSLEALRLYAAAVAHYDDSRPLEALALFERAISIDSDFALAWIGMARCHYRLDQFDQADAAAMRALALRERLPVRDALYVEAWRLSFGPPGPSREKWKLLGATYPDYYAAHYNDALFGAILEHDFRGCVESARRLDAPQNPSRGEGLYLRASCEAGLEHVDEAIELFERSVQLDADGQLLNFADTYATRRDYAAAARIRASADLLGGEAVDLVLRRGEIIYAADRGEWSVAEARAAEIDARARSLDAPLRRSTSLWRNSLMSYRGASPALGERLRADLGRESELMEAESSELREVAVYGALGIGYVAARSGDRALLREVIDGFGARTRQSGYPLHIGLLTMLEAESQRLDGKSDAAIKTLDWQGPDALFYQYHVSRMRSLAALDRPAEALQQADWLASHRGRAYAEQAMGTPLMLLNVVDSNLALLDGAEFALALGDRDGARRRRDELLAVWPTATQIDWLAPRLATLDEALRGS